MTAFFFSSFVMRYVIIDYATLPRLSFRGVVEARTLHYAHNTALVTFVGFSPWHTNRAKLWDTDECSSDCSMIRTELCASIGQLKANYVAITTALEIFLLQIPPPNGCLLTFLWFHMTFTLGLPRRENDWSMTSSWIKLAEWIISAIMAIFLWAFTSCGLWRRTIGC